MCLDTITRYVVLKKDLRVKKIVGYDPFSDSYYHGSIYRQLMDLINNVINSVNNADTKVVSNITTKIKYTSGFHCFPYKTSDERIHNTWNMFKRSILEFTIPKGTKILYGKQDGLTTIVTPILIYRKEE